MQLHAMRGLLFSGLFAYSVAMFGFQPAWLAAQEDRRSGKHQVNQSPHYTHTHHSSHHPQTRA